MDNELRILQTLLKIVNTVVNIYVLRNIKNDWFGQIYRHWHFICVGVPR